MYQNANTLDETIKREEPTLDASTRCGDFEGILRARAKIHPSNLESRVLRLNEDNIKIIEGLSPEAWELLGREIENRTTRVKVLNAGQLTALRAIIEEKNRRLKQQRDDDNLEEKIESGCERDDHCLGKSLSDPALRTIYTEQGKIAERILVCIANNPNVLNGKRAEGGKGKKPDTLIIRSGSDEVTKVLRSAMQEARARGKYAIGEVIGVNGKRGDITDQKWSMLNGDDAQGEVWTKEIPLNGPTEKQIQKKMHNIEKILQEGQSYRLIIEHAPQMTEKQKKGIVLLAKRYENFEVIDRGGALRSMLKEEKKQQMNAEGKTIIRLNARKPGSTMHGEDAKTLERRITHSHHDGVTIRGDGKYVDSDSVLDEGS